MNFCQFEKRPLDLLKKKTQIKKPTEKKQITLDKLNKKIKSLEMKIKALEKKVRMKHHSETTYLSKRFDKISK
tara:strand:+ start:154 stop:372 length:219 start_codon:yes stop_codon:yes gene_type:complete